MYHANVNVDLIEEIVIQINGGIMINVNASVGNVIYVKKIMFGILLHVIENRKYLANVMDDSTIMCKNSSNKFK